MRSKADGRADDPLPMKPERASTVTRARGTVCAVRVWEAQELQRQAGRGQSTGRQERPAVVQLIWKRLICATWSARAERLHYTGRGAQFAADERTKAPFAAQTDNVVAASRIQIHRNVGAGLRGAQKDPMFSCLRWPAMAS